MLTVSMEPPLIVIVLGALTRRPELGTLIESKQIAKQIDDVFTNLIFSKVFTEV